MINAHASSDGQRSKSLLDETSPPTAIIKAHSNSGELEASATLFTRAGSPCSLA